MAGPVDAQAPAIDVARAALDRVHIGYVAVRVRDWVVVDVNELVVRAIGMPREQLIGRDWWQSYNWCDEKQKESFISRLLEQGTVHEMPADRWISSGLRLQMTLSATLVQHLDHGTCMVAFGRGVQAERELAAARQRSEQTLQLLAAHVRDVIYRVRCVPELRVEYVGPGIEAMSGHTPDEIYSDIGLIERLCHPDSLPRLRDILQDRVDFRQPIDIEWVVGDGRHIWTEDIITPVRDDEGRLIALEGVLRDVTERRRLEEQLRQSQKLEIVGLLAGGVAHDFNNLLLPILAQSELMFTEMSASDPRREELRLIHAAAQRAAALVGQLLALGRKQPVAMQDLDINEVVRTLLTVLRWLAGERIALKLELGEALGVVRADAAQLQQVLMNLVGNARDAMPGGGELSISTSRIELDRLAATAAEVAPGLYVAMTVADTGEGMDAATRARIFEPFFTTKPLGKGSGLGLSVVYGIVRRHGGAIKVDSSTGSGTRMTVLLPCQAVEEQTSAAAVSVQPRQRTVLVVDDEDLVRNLVGRILEKSGFRVLSAGSAREAEQLAELAGSVDLLLTDVVMPGIGGCDLAERLRRTRPALKVLFMSGYPADDPNGSLPAGAALLRKPFGLQVLMEAVTSILEPS